VKFKFAAYLGCVSLSALSASAFAQDTAVDQAAAEQGAVEEIVVTGSRVVANGNDSPTPVTVVTVEQMTEVRPSTVAEQLNELPQFAGSQGQSSQAQSGSANAGNANGQGNVLNLRNFGLTRNLILFDGHRVAPTSGGGTVDVNMIPQLLLKRVDVVTGGASAVYGADAVTGVVNFITDTRFNGLKANAQAGISSRGDGGQQDIGLAWGGDLGGRGHLLLSYEFRNEEAIDNRSDRKWGANRYNIGTIRSATANGVTTITQGFVSRAARQAASFGGTISSIGTPANPFANYYFASPGVLSPVSGGTVVNSNVVENGSGSYFDPSLRGSLRMHQLFGRFDYDLTDAVHFYARGAFTDTRNDAYAISNPTFIPNGSNAAPVLVTNPYLPANIANAMRAAGVTRFAINKVFSGPTMDEYRQLTKSYGRNWSVDAGLNGTLGDWKWELAYIHSDNRQRVVQQNAVNGRKLSAALDAVTPAGGGSPVCYVTTVLNTLPTDLQNLYRDCVPMASLFGGTLSQAEADWIFDPLEVTTSITQDDVEGYISGTPFSSWAGPVSVALSGQMRKQRYSVNSSSNPATLQNPLNCAGLRLLTGGQACTATSLEYFQAESLSRPRTAVTVKEVALETNAPLLKDAFLARDLSVSGAYRLTDYSTSGSISSWKVGADWSVTEDLSFRATRSRDIRAPTMHELFAPQSVASYTGVDALLGVALDGIAGRPNPAGLVSAGNPDLRPERADTLTVGGVYRPSWAPGLSLAIDYFDIKVKDAIIVLNGQDVATQTDCIASGGTSPTCALIVRAVDCCSTKAAANAMTLAYQRPINIGRQYTRGVDLELNYAARVFDRPFSLRLLTTYQPKNVLVDPITGVEANNAGAASPSVNLASGAGAKWRSTLIASMEVVDGLKLTVMERWRSAMSWYPTWTGSATANAPVYILQGAPGKVKAKAYTNINLSYRTGPMEFFMNVQNLFDTAPAIYANFNSGLPGNNSVAPGDDPVGRFFTTGVRLKF
jgi:outer membrane receptor protein involved in Fe transport